MLAHLPCLLAALLPAAGAAATPVRYPQARLLIEVAELARPEVAAKVCILDVRPKAKYRAGHIPGAVAVDTAAWNRAFTAGQDRPAWEKRLGALGIDAHSPVVVYGDDLRDTARIWWILRYWDFRDARILNGGWQAWQAAHEKVAKGVPEKARSPKKITLTARPERLAVKEQLLEAIKEKRIQVVDARSQGEYCGEAKTAKRNGSIPGARHLEWSDLVDRKTQRFKDPAKLAELFKKAGIDRDRPAVTYCQSGGRAAVMAFGLELMGVRDVRNYYRSWAEWGNDADTPVAKPEPKK